jgi:hypothetical protein
VPNTEADLDTAKWLSIEYSAADSAPQETGAHVNEGMKRIQSAQYSKDTLWMRMETWDFDVLDLTRDEQLDVILHIFVGLDFFNTFAIRVDVFKAFLVTVCSRYHSNPYHNFSHGVDVCHTTFRLLQDSKACRAITPVEYMSILVAGIVHPGWAPALKRRVHCACSHLSRRGPSWSQQCIPRQFQA